MSKQAFLLIQESAPISQSQLRCHLASIFFLFHETLNVTFVADVVVAAVACVVNVVIVVDYGVVVLVAVATANIIVVAASVSTDTATIDAGADI